jgi:drug/metabolite transporter (DMT)-like permease
VSAPASSAVSPVRHALPQIATLVGAMACFSTSDALAKQMAHRLPAVEIAWFRYVGLMIALLAVWRGNGPLPRSSNIQVQVVRAIGLVSSAVFFIIALRVLPIAEATALSFASPLFVMLLSALMLRERVGRLHWIVVCVGFCGVLLVLRPGSYAFEPAALLPMASSAAWAVALIYTRKAAAHDGVVTTIAYSAGLGFALLSLLALPQFVLPTRHEAILLALMALAWCSAQWLTVNAYHRGEASVLAPFAYSQLLWSNALGYLVFAHIPDALSLAGIGIILACGALGAWSATRESARRQSDAQQPPNKTLTLPAASD